MKLKLTRILALLIASAWRWSRDVWPLLLQCKLHGKAQEAVAALPVEYSLNYDNIKAAVLCASEQSCLTNGAKLATPQTLILYVN